ncbi:MAG: BlaI/MecI/CopY family transcriptional regulator [Acidobacteria bacterium]|nr:BlaI/MecI/CopY family transcriptional regulator [Acidobacteriota bacterium]
MAQGTQATSLVQRRRACGQNCRPAPYTPTKLFVDTTNRFVYAEIVKPKPTASELEILQILWNLGPSTVRQVHENLEGKNGSGYTTTLKLMQIMAEKGLVLRDERERAHVYRPVSEEQETKGRLAGDLMDRVFGGSAAALVLGALSAKPASPEEIDQIRRMLKEYERSRR